MKLALGLTNPLVHIRKELAIGTVMESLLSASTIRQMTSVLTSHVRTALTGFVRRTAHLESRNRLALTMLFNETTRRRCDLTLCPRPARRVRPPRRSAGLADRLFNVSDLLVRPGPRRGVLTSTCALRREDGDRPVTLALGRSTSSLPLRACLADATAMV